MIEEKERRALRAALGKIRKLCTDAGYQSSAAKDIADLALEKVYVNAAAERRGLLEALKCVVNVCEGKTVQAASAHNIAAKALEKSTPIQYPK